MSLAGNLTWKYGQRALIRGELTIHWSFYEAAVVKSFVDRQPPARPVLVGRGVDKAEQSLAASL